MLGKIPVLLQVTYTTYVLHVLQTAAALSKYEHCNNTCKYEIEPVMTYDCYVFTTGSISYSHVLLQCSHFDKAAAV